MRIAELYICGAATDAALRQWSRLHAEPIATALAAREARGGGGRLELYANPGLRPLAAVCAAALDDALVITIDYGADMRTLIAGARVLVAPGRHGGWRRRRGCACAHGSSWDCPPLRCTLGRGGVRPDGRRRLHRARGGGRGARAAAGALRRADGSGAAGNRERGMPPMSAAPAPSCAAASLMRSMRWAPSCSSCRRAAPSPTRGGGRWRRSTSSLAAGRRWRRSRRTTPAARSAASASVTPSRYSSPTLSTCRRRRLHSSPRSPTRSSPPSRASGRTGARWRAPSSISSPTRRPRRARRRRTRRRAHPRRRRRRCSARGAAFGARRPSAPRRAGAKRRRAPRELILLESALELVLPRARDAVRGSTAEVKLEHEYDRADAGARA